MTATRGGLVVVGVLVTLYGAYLALWDRLDQLVGTLVWVAGGVVLHDFVLVPLVLLAVALVGRLLPPRWRAPAAAGLVVLGTVSVVAVPFVGRFGALPDNPTLLDRDYTTGYLVLAGLVVLAVVAGGLRRRGRDTPHD
ncbi:hypothetical protein GCM10009737_32140 [Nocardioides lentus]|uniref:Uncharacterized protein n=1 Tax=Nocardioides lentus TaxID=338077 RepID=A0ABP5B1A2_9ACTN